MNHATLRYSAVLCNSARHLRLSRQSTRRTLTTTVESDVPDIGFPPPLAEVETGETGSKRVRSEKIAAEARAVFVRPWDGISSMPELFAMVRGLERHYGRIREYGVMRDWDFNPQYVPYFWVNFEDTASFERVPETPSLLKIDVPRIDLARLGGIGLDDLHGLLSPQDYVSPEDVQNEAAYQVSTDSNDVPETITIDLRVERAKVPFQLRFKGDRFHQVNSAFRGTFYSWGGFYQPTAPGDVHPATTMRAGVEWRNRALLDRNRSAAAEAGEGVEDLNNMENTPFMQTATSVVDDAAPASAHTPSPATEPAFASVETADATAPATTADVAETTPTAEAMSKPQVPRLSKRELILARARANARAPLPASLLQAEGEEEKEKKEKEEKVAKEREEEQTRLSVRERLWKLVGSRWT
ncbi:hypothetical protein DAEQUDRAFT_809298 [Daedalea quercina L-15889]|uniref:Uncharacterized protein n=1 Tax=Daedalea quercina L-15889 TaxID=1314783 RepID=A0A165SSY2_9APHY|nr:hypothetical protein DAEQUDRAFT_809298 [Daedalea quercina L-15889]